ncbi:WXG100 family type VII secretion target [Lentzea sp. NPDC059081]|uniref:WXG100 family type VII secretion target n=1 Tax=Lentzea sp. NPDC059081 TaxID=3346719 RepID=UPI0036BF059A
MGQLEVDSGNWSAGAGIFDSAGFVAKAVRRAHEGDVGAVAAELGIGSVALALDLAATAIDPLGKLVAAGLGWLIEHVAFLRAPLDLIAGDPPEIKLMAQTLHRDAQSVRRASEELAGLVRRAEDSWSGESADSFRFAADELRVRVDAAAESVDTAGYLVETTMAVIAAVRALVRDIVTSVLGDIVATMLMAIACSWITAGVSIVVGVTKCVLSAVAAVVRSMAKIGKARELSARTAYRLRELRTSSAARPAHAPAPSSAPALPSAAVRRSSPAAAERAVPAEPRSWIGDYEVSWMKRHQRWLDDVGLAGSRQKVRFVEQWLKNHHPRLFAGVKTVSDAKSSSNLVGLAGKVALVTGRHLTDVQEQAEAAWRQAGERAGQPVPPEHAEQPAQAER